MKRREKQDSFAGQRLVMVPRPILATALKQPLPRHLLPTDAGRYPKAKGHICVRKFGCPEVIFIYCAEGNGWWEIAGRKHAITKNQLLVINADTPHVYGAGKTMPWTIHWFHAVSQMCRFIWNNLASRIKNPSCRLTAARNCSRWRLARPPSFCAGADQRRSGHAAFGGGTKSLRACAGSGFYDLAGPAADWRVTRRLILLELRA
jgi:hypothetical protein